MGVAFHSLDYPYELVLKINSNILQLNLTDRLVDVWFGFLSLYKLTNSAG